MPNSKQLNELNIEFCITNAHFIRRYYNFFTYIIKIINENKN